MLSSEVRNQKSILWVLLSCFLFLLSSCNKSGMTDPQTQFPGISHSDSTGTFFSSDPDDWKPISAIGMRFSPPGAYPNPCRAGTGFALAWHLIHSDSILITLNDSPSHVAETIGTWENDSGNYTASAPTSDLQAGIYRVYFKVVRPDTTYVTYGDFQVTN